MRRQRKAHGGVHGARRRDRPALQPYRVRILGPRRPHGDLTPPLRRRTLGRSSLGDSDETSDLGLAGALAATALATGPAAAVVVESCEGVATVENIAEPWEANAKSFYKGEVRLAVVDTGGEPACCSTHLMVLYTEDPGDEPPYRACKMVSDQPGRGFSDVEFKTLKATYDPAAGLTVSVPVVVSKAPGQEPPARQPACA